MVNRGLSPIVQLKPKKIQTSPFIRVLTGLVISGMADARDFIHRTGLQPRYYGIDEKALNPSFCPNLVLYAPKNRHT